MSKYLPKIKFTKKLIYSSNEISVIYVKFAPKINLLVDILIKSILIFSFCCGSSNTDCWQVHKLVVELWPALAGLTGRQKWGKWTDEFGWPVVIAILWSHLLLSRSNYTHCSSVSDKNHGLTAIVLMSRRMACM